MNIPALPEKIRFIRDNKAYEIDGTQCKVLVYWPPSNCHYHDSYIAITTMGNAIWVDIWSPESLFVSPMDLYEAVKLTRDLLLDSHNQQFVMDYGKKLVGDIKWEPY